MNPDLSILTEAERLIFNTQQEQLVPQFRHQFPDPLAPKTVIIIPSLSMDPEILSKISGHIYYEERLLCLLLLLRMPRTHVIYVTSTPIDEEIVDYYLHLIPGVTSMHARKRLTLLSCFDSSNIGLTEKILKRPRLMNEIKNLVPPSHVAHISAFNVTPLEEQLALKLGFPLYGCPSDLSKWGSKTGSREIFKNAGLLVPPGFENIYSIEDIIKALTQLKAEHAWVKKAVVKLNEGFSGDGNAIFKYVDDQIITKDDFKSQLKIVAGELDYTTFIHKLQQMGGIIEAFVEGEIKTSPSVQCLINPLKEIEVVSTHDQILGGESGQVYIGAKFPADAEYRKEIGKLGFQAATYMSSLGVLGRFGIDFVSVKEDGVWKHYAIEINLRKGGTTHPYLMLQLLTNGRYDYTHGLYIMPNGQTRCYMATDALVYENFKKLTPTDLIDVAICNGLHFDGATQEGVMFHLIGAISQHGKLGILSIGSSPSRAEDIYNRTTELLLKETE
ncbi:MAG: peptide ligase PGM1-related protein [Saprospiraceae bacterium]